MFVWSVTASLKAKLLAIGTNSFQETTPEVLKLCVQVKTEELLLLQQRQTELRVETHEEDFSAETLFHSETDRESSDTDNDDDWTPFSCSEAAGNHNNPVQTKITGTAAQNSPN
ncbi:hypothetical protein WMY93_010070 [Mugilogobius chulae]|uniref:Uncharacterized protein n=1 Tax=Mugilogobius chulae TaxID=88201 RepID=A0AAW0P9Q0_9GOBI